MNNKDTIFKCDTCGAEKMSEGDSLHCWDIKYKCGSSIIGAVGRDDHQTDKPCPYKDEADRLKAEADNPDMTNSDITHIEYMNKKREEEIEKFREEYKKDHKCCPKCGALSHSSTLAGYVFNIDKKEEYKDKNRCKCSECGDVHITHDRVPFHYDEKKLIGKEALIIDMITMNKKRVKIEEAHEANKIWIKDDYDWTQFALEDDFNRFCQGNPAWIHPDEILICML